MKQHITPKQAMEISEKQLYSLFSEGIVQRDGWANYHHKKVTIGKMIENLQVGCDFSLSNSFIGSWYVYVDDNEYSNKKLCDALWEAVKDRLESQ